MVQSFTKTLLPPAYINNGHKLVLYYILLLNGKCILTGLEDNSLILPFLVSCKCVAPKKNISNSVNLCIFPILCDSRKH